jgi:antitoxin component YwqK of YwqJK toxin-antitoxin module
MTSSKREKGRRHALDHLKIYGWATLAFSAIFFAFFLRKGQTACCGILVGLDDVLFSFLFIVTGICGLVLIFIQRSAPSSAFKRLLRTCMLIGAFPAWACLGGVLLHYSRTGLDDFGHDVLPDALYWNGQKLAYWPNGRLRSEGNYRFGHSHGRFASWAANGQLLSDWENYNEAPKDGVEKRWNDKGDLVESITWKGGQKDGPFMDVAPEGEWIGNYVKGRKTHEQLLFPNGKVKEELVDNPSSGWDAPLERKIWDKNGRLTVSYHYDEKGQRDGKFLDLGHSGGVYDHGKLSGWEKEGNKKIYVRHGERWKVEYFGVDGRVYKKDLYFPSGTDGDYADYKISVEEQFPTDPRAALSEIYAGGRKDEFNDKGILIASYTRKNGAWQLVK